MHERPLQIKFFEAGCLGVPIPAEEGQNMPLQNVARWRKDHFELKSLEK